MKDDGLSATVKSILHALREIKAERLVIDSFTAFLTASKEWFEYRAFMHLLYKMLKNLGCTTIMTCSIPIGSSGRVYAKRQFRLLYSFQEQRAENFLHVVGSNMVG